MEKVTEVQRQARQLKNEEKKAYLLSYKKYKQEAKRLTEQLEEIRTNEISPSLVTSDMPSAHNQRDLSDYIVKCDKIYSSLIKARKNAIERFTEVQSQIELLEDGNEKDILTLRYLRNYTWEKICVEMGYSWKQIHRIHAKALQNFKIKDDIE